MSNAQVGNQATMIPAEKEERNRLYVRFKKALIKYQNDKRNEVPNVDVQKSIMEQARAQFIEADTRLPLQDRIWKTQSISNVK